MTHGGSICKAFAASFRVARLQQCHIRIMRLGTFHRAEPEFSVTSRQDLLLLCVAIGARVVIATLSLFTSLAMTIKYSIVRIIGALCCVYLGLTLGKN